MLTCARCGHGWSSELIVLLDWRDREAINELHRTVPCVPCPSCGGTVTAHRSIVVMRPSDPVPVLFAIDGSDPTDVATLEDLLARHVSNDQGVVVGPVANIEHALLPSVAARYTGFALLGADDPAGSLNEQTGGRLGAWLRAVMSHHLEATIPVLTAFFDAVDETAAKAVFAEHQDVDFAAWLPALRRKPSEPAVNCAPDAQALGQDSRVSLLSHLLSVGPDFDRDEAHRYIALLEELTRFNHSSDHTAAGFAAAIEVARELVALARSKYGPDHPMTLTAENDAAALMLDQPALHAEALALLQAARVGAARSGRRILADITTNLGIATLSKTRIPSADDYEEAIRMLRDALHLHLVLDPDGPERRLAVIVNLSASIRSSLTRSETLNTAEAMALLAELQEIADDSLSDPTSVSAHDRVTRQTNALNALATDAQLHPGPVTDAALDTGMRALEDMLDSLPPAHPVRVKAQANLGSIATDRLLREPHSVELRERAERWLENAITDTEGFAADDATRVLSRMTLAALLTSVDPDGADLDRATRLLTDCAADLASTSTTRLHQVVLSNLAQAHLMRGDLDQARSALQQAAAHADALIGQERTPATRLGQASATGDLFQRLAFMHAYASDARSAIHTIERARARWRPAEDDPEGFILDDRVARALQPCTALIYAGTCSLGTYAVVVTPDGAGTFTWPIPSTVLQPILTDLTSGRADLISEAVDRAAAHLGPTLVDTVLQLAEGVNAHTLLAVWGGTLTALPMAHLPGIRGTLAEHLDVNNLVGLRRTKEDASERSAAGVVAAAIVDPTGDLLFARTEVQALHQYATTVVEPGSHGIKGWLLDNIADVDHLHLACHGEADPHEPFNSRFLLGDNLAITVGELADIDLHGINLAVATSCSSGVVDQRAADEQIGLGAALLAAGARGVVAALWELDDLGTSVVVAKFYQRLGAGDPPQLALTHAQHWVANTSTAQLLAETDRHAHFNGWLPPTLADEIRALCLHPSNRKPDARPFNAPARWAALMYLS